jgi:hypothetical protein
MKEFNNFINFYSNEGSIHWFAKAHLKNWLNLNVGEEYLGKYWLSEKEYFQNWKSIQNKIFVNQENGLPNLKFKNEFLILPLRGGSLFDKSDFESLMNCLIDIGEKYFVVIENTYGEKSTEIAFRMKYPTNISWDEITNGNFISETIIGSMHKEFFVFGENTNWGKYSASEYESPLNLIAFKPIYKALFQKQFLQDDEEKMEILNNWLPKNYVKLLVDNKNP